MLIPYFHVFFSNGLIEYVTLVSCEKWKSILAIEQTMWKPYRISDQILQLNAVLDETAKELERLKTETSKFGSTLESASSNIDTSVTTISSSVENIEEGSSQLNALLFPIVSSIAIILALQIVIIARRR